MAGCNEGEQWEVRPENKDGVRPWRIMDASGWTSFNRQYRLLDGFEKWSAEIGL